MNIFLLQIIKKKFKKKLMHWLMLINVIDYKNITLLEYLFVSSFRTTKILYVILVLIRIKKSFLGRNFLINQKIL